MSWPSSPVGAADCTGCLYSCRVERVREKRSLRCRRSLEGRRKDEEDADEDEDEAGQRKIIQPPHWRWGTTQKSFEKAL